MKIVIIGGVAGGATAATRLRRLSENDEIIILERDEHVSYANCGLPYYIGDVITDKDDLLVQTASGLKKRFNLDIRVKNEVLAIDKANKTLKITKLSSGEIYSESYDKLILSCGSKAIRPNIAGINEAKNVFTLKNIPDTFAIKEFINSNNIKNAVIVGGGFIGVELAENFANLKLSVTIVEKKPQVLSTIDFEMAQAVHAELINNNIKLVLNDGVAAFEDGGKTVKLESGNKIEADIIILAIGVSPLSSLAKAAELVLGDGGHIVTDDNFNVCEKPNSINKDIFAIGDMIEVINPLDNCPYAVALAWGANRQGRLVADYINGIKIKKSKIMGSNVIKVFNLTVSSTGCSEEILCKKGLKYTAIHLHRANHASYYPGSSNLSLKILFNPDNGKILGAQAVGKEGTEKRIDVLSTVMRLGGTVNDLSDLEICYAPPYSSAKDPVNILGYIAESIIDNVYKPMYHYQVDDFVKGGGLLIDVRTPSEFTNGHIEGAINISLDTLRDNLSKIKADKTAKICVNCQGGQRSYLAIRILKGNGYTNLFNLSGGFVTYRNYKYKTGNNKIDPAKICCVYPKSPT